MRAHRGTAVIGCLLFACVAGPGGGGTASNATSEVVAAKQPPAQPAVRPAEVEGYWSGDWGQLVLKAVGDEVHGAYVHDQGTLVGAFSEDGVFRGWWCEKPSRQPVKDAGEVEFRFANADGAWSLDGRWRYGDDGGWRENWDLARVDGEPPAPLVERFADPTTFCRHP